MSPRRLPSLALSVLFAVAGCATTSDPPAPSPPPPAPAPTPPKFDAIDIPEWPPLSATGSISLRLSDDERLSRLTATFKNVTRRTLDGTSGTVVLSGADLGEGMGTLTLVACDARSSCRERRVNDFLVDMTPPEAELERASVSPKLEGLDGQVAVWVSDAWVLGSVDLTFGGKTLRHDFPKAYPTTVGTEWDVSRVAFAASELPEREGDATVVVRDAAGNARTETFRLRIDGKAPTATIAEPAPGAAVSSSFAVRVLAEDDGPAPAIVELWVGGARILEAAAPLGVITVDASTLPAGPTELRAVARDEAGNRSAAALVTVQVVH